MRKNNYLTFIAILGIIGSGKWGYCQSFVSQDSRLNPIGLRKHIELSFMGGIPTLGIGVATFKQKHSWSFTANAGIRKLTSSILPVNEVMTIGLQTAYRHRIRTLKAPVFWQLNTGVTYAQYKQTSPLLNPAVTLEGFKVYPNIGVGAGYVFPFSDKKALEVFSNINYQPLNTRISEEVNGVIKTNGTLFISNGVVVYLTVRYSFD